MLGNYLKLLPPNSPYMGWWASEGDGVAAAAAYGVPVYAADWSSNLTVLGGDAARRHAAEGAAAARAGEQALHLDLHERRRQTFKRMKASSL